MSKPEVFALGTACGAMACVLACAGGKALAQILFDHSVIYPHAKEN